MGKKNMNPVRASFWFIFSSFLLRAISIITTPLYTRLLSESDYGIVSVYNAWSGIFSVIFTLSIAANAFNKGLIEFKNDRNNFVSSMLGLTAMLVMIGFGLFLIFKNLIIPISGLSFELFSIMFLGLYLNVVVGFWGLCQKFDEKYASVIFVNISFSIISTFMTYFAVKYAKKDLATIKILFDSLLTYIFAIVLTFNVLRKSYRVYIKKYWRFALTFCIPIIPHYLANHLLNQSDRLMITYYLGTDKTAIYSVAYMASQIIMICWATISGVFGPWLYKRLDESRERDIRDVTSLIFLGVFIVSIIVIVVAPEFMTILAPATYKSGIFVIPPIVAGTYILFICMMYSNIELFYNTNNFKVTLATLTAAIVNTALNWISIPKYGITGAAYSTYIGYLVMFLIHHKVLRDMDKMKLFNNRIIYLTIICVSLIAIVIPLFYSLLWIRLLMLFVFFIIAYFLFKEKFIHILKKKDKRTEDI